MSARNPAKKNRLGSGHGVKIRVAPNRVRKRREVKVSAARVRRVVEKNDRPEKKVAVSAADVGAEVEAGVDVVATSAIASEGATTRLETIALNASRSVSSITSVPKRAKYVQIGKSNRSRRHALSDKNDRSGQRDLREGMCATNGLLGNGRKNLIAETNARNYQRRFEKSRRSRPR